MQMRARCSRHRTRRTANAVAAPGGLGARGVGAAFAAPTTTPSTAGTHSPHAHHGMLFSPPFAPLDRPCCCPTHPATERGPALRVGCEMRGAGMHGAGRRAGRRTSAGELKRDSGERLRQTHLVATLLWRGTERPRAIPIGRVSACGRTRAIGCERRTERAPPSESKAKLS